MRSIAEKIWAVPCLPDRIGGVNIDGVCRIDPELQICIEATVEKNLNKVRDDIIKLNTAKHAALAKGIVIRAFCVVNSKVTPAMKEAAEASKVRVLTLEDFSRLFFNFYTYKAVRQRSAFGSAISPITGDPDDTRYVPVRYTVEGKNEDADARQIAEYLWAGKDVLLVGEYGSGKSRCIKQLFDILSTEADARSCYPIAIDLRKSWGLRSANEIVRRHFNELGLDDLESSAIRAFKSRSTVFLIDGFDEIGSQAWSSDASKIRAIRAKSLEGVKDIVQSNSGGTLIAGREHYFTSSSEMFSALGLDKGRTVVIRSKDEFNDTELLEYFSSRDVEVALPRWLPRRPLICQTISKLGEDELERMFGIGGSEVEFWDHFISVICARDASTHITFDSDTIYRIFLYLARLTRMKPANVGPVSLTELQAAFEYVTGSAPVEEASVMLQRLPSLGRVSSESNDRQFVDMYILDGLRAKDLIEIPVTTMGTASAVFSEIWTNPLEELGQRIFSSSKNISMETKLNLARRALDAGNKTLASDVVASLFREGAGGTFVDFGGLELQQGTIVELSFRERDIANLTLESCYISVVVLPERSCSNVVLRNCLAEKVRGVSSAASIPAWFERFSGETFDSVTTVSMIRRIGLKPSHEILTAIVRKTYFQRGAGRKEEALLRGLGRLAPKSVAEKILRLMISEGLLTSFRGDEGLVYSPVRSHAARMQAMLDDLSSSKDPLWLAVDKL